MGLPSILFTLFNSNQTQNAYNDIDQAHAAHANNAVQNNQAEQMEQGTEQNLERKAEGVMDIDITAASNAINTNVIDIKNNAAATNAEATVETTQRPFNKNKEDLFPLEKLPNELLLKVLEHLSGPDLARASVRSARIKELADVIFIDRMDSAQKFIARCIQHDLNRYQLPGKETLLNIARKNISEEIYLLWAQETKKPKPVIPSNEDIQTAHTASAAQALTPEELEAAQKKIYWQKKAFNLRIKLFSVIQSNQSRLFKDLFHQGKLSANQWESWFSCIQKMGETPMDDPIHKDPFYFYEKVKIFLKTALMIKNNSGPESWALFNDVRHILLALRDGHINETQLDQWMRNPSYDLGVISELCQRMSPSLNTEQITADPKAIEALSDLKIKMGPQLHDWLNIAEDNLSLPMAMQAAYASGIDLQKTTLKIREKIIFKKTHVAPVICQLFGHRMWEYSTDITQALSQKLISPEDIEQHFLLPSGYFSESKNTQKFLSHALPRILKKEITFKEVIAALDQLNATFQKFRKKFPEDYLPSAYIRLFCHGVPLQELNECLSYLTQNPYITRNLLALPTFISCLEDGTVTLKKMLSWLNDSPTISQDRLSNFVETFALVRAGKLDLDTLERWMRDNTIFPVQGIFTSYASTNFSLFIAQHLKDLEENQNDFDFTNDYLQTLKAQLEALDTAKEIDRYIKNSLQKKGA